jgi:hypothetical protein
MYSANIPPIDIDANLSARIGTLFVSANFHAPSEEQCSDA